jgi:HSP20 family molecular chaperone IbpA
VDDDVLTIRGEKKSETEDASRDFSGRYYGRFERTIALPFEVEEDRAEACRSSRSVLALSGTLCLIQPDFRARG